MLEERVEDKSFLKLIRKWLKAGILEEDGKIISPVTGTPQGGSIFSSSCKYISTLCTGFVV